METLVQCVAAIKRANRVLEIIKKGIENKAENVIMPLYKSLVHVDVEYCVQLPSAYLQKDIVNVEKVQKSAIRIWRDIEKFPYEGHRGTKRNSHMRRG